MMSATGSSCDV